MQQPYRQMVLASGAPMTCLDPPRRPPCADAPPRRRRAFRVLAAGGLLAFAVAPALAVMCTAPHAHAGQIQIAPEALTRLRQTKHTQTKAPSLPPPPPSPVSAVPQRVMIPWFDGPEHEPAKIVAQARRMQGMGVDLSLVDVELPRSTVDCFDTFGYWPALAFPAMPGSRTITLDLGDLPADSPALSAGVQKGDVLLSIDGHRIEEWSRKDIDKIRARGSIALELDRNGRRVLLTVHWRTHRSAP